MKKAVTIVLLAIYIFGNTQAGQLLKLPLLVTHYVQHKAENPQISFLAFLKIHYVDPQPYDADYQQDMQLPFKTPVDVCCVNIPVVLPPAFNINFKEPDAGSTAYNILNDEVPVCRLAYSVFQPPRA